MAAGWTNRDNRDDTGSGSSTGRKKEKKQGTFNTPTIKDRGAAAGTPSGGGGEAAALPYYGSGDTSRAGEGEPVFRAPEAAPGTEGGSAFPVFDYRGSMERYDPAADSAVLSAREALSARMNDAPEYQDPYGEELADLYERITGRGDFQYDLEGDPLYQQYRALYLRDGRLAMEDTMGQAAALTGGYGSSYGQSVGQQQYNAYLQRLNEAAPELYDRAFERWQSEGTRLDRQFDRLRELQQDEYGRYRDAVADWRADLKDAREAEALAYDRGVDAWQRDRSLEETAYDRAADQWRRDMQLSEAAYDRAADQYDRDFALYQERYRRQQDGLNTLQKLLQNSGYIPSQQELLSLGLNEEEAEALQASLQPAPAAGGAESAGQESSAAAKNSAKTKNSQARAAFNRAKKEK